MAVLDLLIVGAGPSGLATAIAARQQGLTCEILEKGVLVNSIFHFPAHMVFFTTPELLEIGGLPLVTPYDKPTRIEALRYYRRVAEKFQLPICFGEEVTGLQGDQGEQGDQGDQGEQGEQGEQRVLTVRSRTASGERERQARAVVFAIGYYDHPNRLGVPGEDLPHVSHYYQEAHSSYRKRVVIVGGKNSAAEAALEMYRGGAHVTMVHRRATLGASIKYWVKPDIENRIAEGSIAARFESRVIEITPDAVVIEHAGERESLPADQVLLLTGYHADFELLARSGIAIDEASGIPQHDPATLESTSMPGVFFAGGVLAGKDTAPIFIENGRFHGERIIRVIGERR
jgi:bacillithiol disulfide reductase